jgi:hypothetical protein
VRLDQIWQDDHFSHGTITPHQIMPTAVAIDFAAPYARNQVGG